MRRRERKKQNEKCSTNISTQLRDCAKNSESEDEKRSGKAKGIFLFAFEKKLTRFLTTHQKASYNFCIFYETSGKLVSLCFFCVGIDSLQNRIVPGEFSTLC